MPTSQPCLSRLAAYVCATPRPGHGAPNYHLVALRRRMAAALMGCTTSHWPERSIVTDTRLRHGMAPAGGTVAFCCHIFQQAESFVNWWRSFRIWHEHLWAWRISKIWSFQLCDRLAARVGSFHLLKRRCESFWQPCSSQEISGNSLGGMNQSAGPATRKNMACQFSSISD